MSHPRFARVGRVKSSWTVVSVGCLLASLVTAAPAMADGWQSDFEAAEAAARQAGKPLLVHFYADWCGPCRAMEAQTLHKPEVRQFLAGPVIGVKINSDHRQDLIHRFGIRTLPTDILVDADGQVLMLTRGVKSPQQYVATLRGTAERSYAANRPQVRPETGIAEQTPAETGVETRPLQTPATVASQAHGSEQGAKSHRAVPDERVDLDTGATVPVDMLAPPMLRGFSPVALHEGRHWTKGSREYEAIFRGQTYLMATAEEKRLFEENPRRYTPRLLGCDAVLFATEDRAVPGAVEWAAFFRDELYLFSTDENRRKFKQSPENYTSTRVVERDSIETVTR